ncbi:hypothetical protein BD309DRAFT_961228 [Dichomitus squalens]|nr:hypothetical protein BD309DRAFT_961228 [Dichomitus squalens]
MPPRHVLPGKAKELRNALYDVNKCAPSYDDKMRVLEAIRESIPHVGWYDKKRHLTWCSGKEHASLRKDARLKHTLVEHVRGWLASQPDPPFSLIKSWAAHAGVTPAAIVDVIMIVESSQTDA